MRSSLEAAPVVHQAMVMTAAAAVEEGRSFLPAG
jgi:hypothetical protein